MEVTETPKTDLEKELESEIDQLRSELLLYRNALKHRENQIHLLQDEKARLTTRVILFEELFREIQLARVREQFEEDFEDDDDGEESEVYREPEIRRGFTEISIAPMMDPLTKEVERYIGFLESEGNRNAV